jgi:YD repeat-containing protein
MKQKIKLAAIIALFAVVMASFSFGVTAVSDEGIVLISYDGLDRVSEKTAGIETVTYNYDDSATGMLSSVETPDIEKKYKYDEQLRVIEEEKIINGMSFTISYTYDSLGRLVSKTLPNGEVITFGYGEDGLLDSVSDVVNNIDYNALGLPVNKEYNNGLVTDYSYSPANFRLTGITTEGVQDIEYEYDAAGNVMEIRDAISSATNSMGYDGIDRLTSIKVENSALPEAGYLMSYEYNSIGNLIKVVSDDSTTYTYEYGLTPVHAPTAIHYDGPVPVLEPVGEKTVDENSPVNFALSINYGISTTAGNNDDGMSYSASGLPEGASFDRNSLTFSWTPNYEQSGTYIVTFGVEDGMLSDYEDATIIVSDVNRAPIIDLGDFSKPDNINEGDSNAFKVTANDPDKDELSYTWKLDDVEVSEESEFVYNPGFDSSGEHTITIVVNDGKGLDDSAEFVVEVIDVNRVPVIDSLKPEGAVKLNNGESYDFVVGATDLDGDGLSYSWKIDDEEVSTESAYTFTAGNDDAENTVTITVSDGEAEVTKQFGVTVATFDCTPGQTRPCSLQSGVCIGSVEVCADEGIWLECTMNSYGTDYEAEELTCDNLDNDCNGLVDEGVKNACGQCGPVPFELCNDGIDNNCDGTVDEGCYVAPPPVVTPPPPVVTPPPVYNPPQPVYIPPVEKCEDNDADGDGYGINCELGPDECENDASINKKNSCGVCAPEPVNPEGSTCSVGIGECQNFGEYVCIWDGSTVCNAAEGSPSDEVCDGLDNNCNNEVDEELTRSTNEEGACSVNTESCVDGNYISNNEYVPTGSDLSCNGIDDDCDDQTDEDYISTETNCGVGECSAKGTTSCVDGNVVDSCSPEEPDKEGEALCDNLDNDCNGKVDDGLFYEQSCGYKGTEIVMCSEGKWTPGECAQSCSTTDISDGCFLGFGCGGTDFCGNNCGSYNIGIECSYGGECGGWDSCGLPCGDSKIFQCGQCGNDPCYYDGW